MSQIKRTLDRNTPRVYECRVLTMICRTASHNSILITQSSRFCFTLFYLLLSLFKQENCFYLFAHECLKKQNKN